MFDISNILFLLFFIIITFKKVETSEDIYETEIIKNRTFEGYEKGKGAYYIAYSPYRTGFTLVSTYIQLPSSLSLNTTKGRRNAFISLGIQGKYGYIDMGIMNTGDYWMPYYNDNGELKINETVGSDSKTKLVGIVIEFNNNKQLKCSFGYRELDDSLLEYSEFNIFFSHIVEYNNEGNPIFRFYRFASLENLEDFPDNQNDNTYMINGGFLKPTIYINGNEESWRINSGNVEACWKVSAKRIEMEYNDEKEKFSIKYFNCLLHNLNLNFFHFMMIVIYLL